MEVLDVDVFIWGCFSLAPEEKPFFGRGLCKAYNDRKIRSKLNHRIGLKLNRPLASGLGQTKSQGKDSRHNNSSKGSHSHSGCG